MAAFDFTEVGGTPLIQGDGSVLWNFGVLDGPSHVRARRDGAPYLYDAFPALQGKWDGTSTVNHHEAVRRVLGQDIKAHKQPRGSCGGRAGSRSLEILQCILKAAGKRTIDFKYVSHAWPYYLARREANMLSGGDGVPSWSIGAVLEKFGALSREESGDAEQAGPSSDDLAVKWGAGQISREDRARFEALAKDNLVTVRVRARSAQEMADGIAAGGIVLCSDMQGWTMQRDRDGFCSPEGQWAHYHIRSGIHVVNGRRGFAYNQSWGDDTPGGPPVNGCPGNVFLTPWEEEDRLARREERDVIFGFNAWELESNEIDLDWIF